MQEHLLLLGAVFCVGILLPIIPFFPVRLAVLIPIAASIISPWAVVITAAFGTSIGTLPLFLVGRRMRGYPAAQRWTAHRTIRTLLRVLNGHMFFATLVFALLPLPDQLMSVIAGYRSYPAWKMALGFFIGRLPYFVLLAWIGASNDEAVLGSLRTLLNLFSL